MKNSQFKWSYKLFMFLLTFGFLIGTYIYFLLGKSWGYQNNNNIPFQYGEYSVFYWSFFTVQTNLIVAIYFLLALVYHQQEDKMMWTGQKAKIWVASYITITGIVWNGILLPTILTSGNPKSAISWILDVIPHIIVPILTVVYVVMNIGQSKIRLKEYLKKDLPIFLIYPLVYFAYAMIRGEMRWLDGKGNLSFPYPFLNFHQSFIGIPGLLLIVLAFILILLLFIATNIGYLLVNNKNNRK